MNCTSNRLPYSATGYFSKIITDYLQQHPDLAPFYQHRPDFSGMEAVIKERQLFPQQRAVLVSALQDQYATLNSTQAVKDNIQLLANNNTFTITTAHQPVIFTGTLFFIYKILHVIKLAEACKQRWPQYNFVPLFYMGSEDADLDELGSIWLNNEKITWDTRQTGAVGRMKTSGLQKIITRIEGELSVQPHGPALIQLLKECYLQQPDIQSATLQLVDALFNRYGLVVLIPDNPRLKTLLQPVFEDDLFHQTASQLAARSIESLGKHYKVQAHPRAINLFYLKDDIRERIEKNGEHWEVVGKNIRFNQEELLQELAQHPERFSPNVILRGLYQETILPNIAFVGGGGELAYWLELKAIFTHYKVPYPVLLLRNSFLVVEKKWQEKIARLGFCAEDFFKPAQILLSSLVSRGKGDLLQLEQELEEVKKFYGQLKEKAGKIDSTLEKHIEALRAKATRPLYELEKKMLRAEKRKYNDESRQLQAIKSALFPMNSLQERIENFMPYYAKWGPAFIDSLYEQSLTTEQEFFILYEDGAA
ncbi:MAG TPA: bacillithiol biosynthesis cysteine-adding enzyme BshC [Chitinophagaceae bacterium]|nr:bacillithiol biosynthesis cysteine-adding enzyme BshC [Chitinophagaceae bacterium]